MMASALQFHHGPIDPVQYRALPTSPLVWLAPWPPGFSGSWLDKRAVSQVDASAGYLFDTIIRFPDQHGAAIRYYIQRL